MVEFEMKDMPAHRPVHDLWMKYGRPQVIADALRYDASRIEAVDAVFETWEDMTWAKVVEPLMKIIDRNMYTQEQMDAQWARTRS